MHFQNRNNSATIVTKPEIEIKVIHVTHDQHCDDTKL